MYFFFKPDSYFIHFSLNFLETRGSGKEHVLFYQYIKKLSLVIHARYEGGDIAEKIAD